MRSQVLPADRTLVPILGYPRPRTTPLTRATNFDVITHMARAVFYGVSHAVAYCTDASRGLSAIAFFLLCSLACEVGRAVGLIAVITRPTGLSVAYYVRSVSLHEYCVSSVSLYAPCPNQKSN